MKIALLCTVSKPDEAYEIGVGMEPIAAYLSVEEIIRVAKLSGADAIHPGYGLFCLNPQSSPPRRKKPGSSLLAQRRKR